MGSSYAVSALRCHLVASGLKLSQKNTCHHEIWGYFHFYRIASTYIVRKPHGSIRDSFGISALSGSSSVRPHRMVFYIRFLKTPRFQKQKGAVSVSALICITTDLGDAFLAEDAHLLATLSVDQTERILYKEPLKWTAGKRELPISLGPFPEHLARQTVVLGVSAIEPRRPETRWNDDILGATSAPLVVSGWSAPFGGSQSLVAEKLVERRFGPTDRLDLRIWEETGNSIARHIW